MNRIGCVRGGIVVESEVFDGVCFDGYSDIIFLTQIWCNGKGIDFGAVGSRFQCSGCGTCQLSRSAASNPVTSSVKVMVMSKASFCISRWYTGNILNLWREGVNLGRIGYAESVLSIAERGL